jgi:hypothetical protein
MWQWSGFVTGIPWVQFLHTVPVPMVGTHQPAVFAVCHKTHGIPFTCGYLQLFLFKYTYLYKYMDETEPPGLGFMWLSVEKKQKINGRGSRSLPCSYPPPHSLVHAPPTFHPPSSVFTPPVYLCSPFSLHLLMSVMHLCRLIPVPLLACSCSSHSFTLV